MLKVTSYSVLPVSRNHQTFKANINTRQLLETIDSDEYSGQGHARIQKMISGKRACKEAFKERCGEYLVYRGCKRKHRYDSEYEASRAIKAMATKIYLTLDFYECPLCGGWHLCKAVNKMKRAILF